MNFNITGEGNQIKSKEGKEERKERERVCTKGWEGEVRKGEIPVKRLMFN